MLNNEELYYEVRDIIRQMFENGDISINVKTEADYYGTVIKTNVQIGNKTIYTHEEPLKIF